MAVAEPVEPLDDIEHAILCVRQAADIGARKLLIRELLRGPIDYATPAGRTIGTRRALLCSRLREEGLWPDA